MKECFKCHRILPLDDFYAHPMMADGHVNKCKECNKADCRASRAAKIEYYQQYDRDRASEPHRVSARKKYAIENKSIMDYGKSRWRDRNPHKTLAHIAVSSAIKIGKLTKCPCAICGRNDSEAHHEDYSLPLDVVWLCSKDHKARHKLIRKCLRSGDQVMAISDWIAECVVTP